MIEVFICLQSNKYRYIQAKLSCTSLRASSPFVFTRALLARVLFTITPKWRACSQANLDLELLLRITCYKYNQKYFRKNCQRSLFGII